MFDDADVKGTDETISKRTNVAKVVAVIATFVILFNLISSARENRRLLR